MTAAGTWFVVLAGVCLIGAYALGVPPNSRRQWLYLGITIGFLAWLLPFMASLRST
jgi:hypothetical protein